MPPGHYIRLERCCAFGTALVRTAHPLICVNFLPLPRDGIISRPVVPGLDAKESGRLRSTQPHTGAVFKGSRYHCGSHCTVIDRTTPQLSSVSIAASTESTTDEPMAGAAHVVGDPLPILAQPSTLPLDFEKHDSAVDVRKIRNSGGAAHAHAGQVGR